MKLSLPPSVAVRWMRFVVIAVLLQGTAKLRAQSGSPQFNTAGFQEQGDEMSRRVGGFFRKLFYGEDRNENGYRPQPAAPGYQPAPQPRQYEAAPPPQPRQYQTAPPPAKRKTDSTAVPQRPRTSGQSSGVASKKSQSHPPEAEKTKRKEPPAVASHSSSSNKHTDAPEKAHKKPEEPATKSVAKHKNPVPPTPEEESKKSSKPPYEEAAAQTETVIKAPSGANSTTKTAKNSGATDSGAISPYADDRSNSGSTLIAPKDSMVAKNTPPEKPAEPKKTETKSTTNDGTFPVGTKSKTNPGTVVSPYPPFNELDVGGLSSGSLAVDPTTKKVFRVP